MTSVSGTQSDLPAGAEFHEGLAATWSQGYRRGSFRRRLAVMSSILDGAAPAGSDWLDMGCGSGVLTRALLERGARVTGVDGSPAMIEAARANTPDEGRVSWLVSDVERIAQLADSSFDGIVCSSVIEYVATPKALLEEAARLLRPEGVLVVSVPNSASPVRFAQKILRRIAKLFGMNPFTYLEYSIHDSTHANFKALLGDCGFRVEDVEVFDPFVSRRWGFIAPSALLIFSARKNKAHI
jgi:2-polyprenyl-6-hydroxyphenyl methylase/3-demethylubiquinone-9 3-methyltransferase